MEPCRAGLTASEVVVVVNGDSLNSRTLANHYVQLRSVPSRNVIVLDSVPNSEIIPVEEFREQILKPILKQIAVRGLSSHVQCVAYSADFPTAIDIQKDLETRKDVAPIFTPVASINSLTYLVELSITGNPAYILPEVNYYARRPMSHYFSNPVGQAIESQWKSIERQMALDKHAEALEELLELSQKLPHQFPLKYLAATQAARANQPEEAIKLLEAAIREGWNSGGYLAQDRHFNSIRRRDDFQLLELSLDKDLGKWQPTIGFNNRTFWAPNGVRFFADSAQGAPGMKYLLSIVLGVTRGNGTTLQEAIDNLTRSSQADFTHPTGVFCFSSTADIRTKTREPLFNDAIAELKRLGFDAEIIETALPRKRNENVLGAQIGTPRFTWTTENGNLVPGAIVDNLTSFGGIMTPPPTQTNLSALLKAGAAGSSGTVTEPFAIASKFPTPYLYVHYAQGATLVEAFYQSVSGPYQLLVVGDPLCQPFSNAPQQEIDSDLNLLDHDESLTLNVDTSGPKFSDWLQLPDPPSQRTLPLAPVRIAVQIDGTVPRGGSVQPRINIKLTGVPAGYHDIQVLMIADDPLNQRSLTTVPIWIGPPDAIQLTLDRGSAAAPSENAGHGDGVSQGEPIQVSLQTEELTATVIAPPESNDISIWHHFETIATSSQESPSQSPTTLTFNTSQLGMGPVRLQAKAKLPDGTIIASRPLWIEVVP